MTDLEAWMKANMPTAADEAELAAAANTAQQFIWGGNGAAGAGTSLWYPVS